MKKEYKVTVTIMDVMWLFLTLILVFVLAKPIYSENTAVDVIDVLKVKLLAIVDDDGTPVIGMHSVNGRGSLTLFGEDKKPSIVMQVGKDGRPALVFFGKNGLKEPKISLVVGAETTHLSFIDKAGQQRILIGIDENDNDGIIILYDENGKFTWLENTN